MKVRKVLTNTCHITRPKMSCHRDRHFLHDAVECGRAIRVLSVVGACTRELCHNSICRSTHHARNWRLVNSGPLSQRIASGCPRSAMIGAIQPQP
jgi:hypothetical protein